MSAPLGAAAVHLRTATGAAFALLALIAAAQADWRWMFIWLGVALIVDSIDGPLARRFSVTRVLPRWSGERLDLIVDFLTYVMVPAFALSQADLLPPPWRLPAGIAIVVSSLFHMADQESKTKEGYFVGFPAIWNVVCLYFCIPALAIRRARHRCTFCHAHFVPILSVHPFRVAELRSFTRLVTALWAVAAIGAVANPFPSPLWVKVLLAATAAGLSGVGAFRALLDRTAK